jgi:hypothetical protein
LAGEAFTVGRGLWVTGSGVQVEPAAATLHSAGLDTGARPSFESDGLKEELAAWRPVFAWGMFDANWRDRHLALPLVTDPMLVRNEGVGRFTGSSETDPTYGFTIGYHTLKEEGP